MIRELLLWCWFTLVTAARLVVLAAGLLVAGIAVAAGGATVLLWFRDEVLSAALFAAGTVALSWIAWRVLRWSW